MRARPDRSLELPILQKTTPRKVASIGQVKVSRSGERRQCRFWPTAADEPNREFVATSRRRKKRRVGQTVEASCSELMSEVRRRREKASLSIGRWILVKAFQGERRLTGSHCAPRKAGYLSSGFRVQRDIGRNPIEFGIGLRA
jgi:hypothetical protein